MSCMSCDWVPLWVGHCLATSWLQCSAWHPKEWPELATHLPPRHADYRDLVPPSMAEVARAYQDLGFVERSRWTFGLLDMWSPKAKFVKQAVHIPCWDSFRWNPLGWRGLCFGRTFKECFYTGLRQSRWSRAAYGGVLGGEYYWPVQDVGRTPVKSDIKALCFLYCLAGCICSCGIGQIFTLCGNLFCNFGAIYSCHSRERLRRRFDLPPAFCLPPGIDDFLVHFLCFYCSSHQEIRELAVRGIDGPGLHIQDVLQDSFPSEADTSAAARAALVAEMLSHPPQLFKSRVPVEDRTYAKPKEHGTTPSGRLASEPISVDEKAGRATGTKKLQLERKDRSEMMGVALGWGRYIDPSKLPCNMAPEQQMMMQRSRSATASGAMPRSEIEVRERGETSSTDESSRSPRKAWSIAY